MPRRQKSSSVSTETVRLIPLFRLKHHNIDICPGKDIGLATFGRQVQFPVMTHVISETGDRLWRVNYLQL